MKALDLKRFKKIASDKKSTTMKHDDGHELTIAHSALSKNLLGQLSKLPMVYAEPQDDKELSGTRYDEGGDVENDQEKYLSTEGISDPSNLRSVAEHEARSYGQDPFEAPKILSPSNKPGASDYSGPGVLGQSVISPKTGSMPTSRSGEPPLVGDTSPGGYIVVGGNNADQVNTVRHEMSHQNFHKNPYYGADVKYGEKNKMPAISSRSVGDPTHGFAPEYKGQTRPGTGYLLPGMAEGGDPSDYDFTQNASIQPKNPTDPTVNLPKEQPSEAKPDHAREQADYWVNQQYSWMPEDFKKQKSDEMTQKIQDNAANIAQRESGSQTQVIPSVPTSAAAPVAPMPQQTPIAATPRPASIPTRTTAVPVPVSQQVAQNVLTDDQDLQRQFKMWTPQVKTYSDLFAQKNTLGKIGTLFGLLVGGAGAGLTHTTNPVLDAMDQTLKNDLDAQKSGRTNVIDWRKMTLQHELQKSQAGHLAVEDMVSLDNLAQIRMMRFYQAKQYNDILKMPDGPMKQQALQAFSMMSSAMDAKAQDAASSIGARTEFFKSIMNPAQNAPTGGAIDYNRMNQLERQSTLKMPGALPESVINEATKESKDVEESRSLRKSYLDSFNKLDKMAFAGKLSPNQRAAEINALGAKLATMTSHRFNAQEAAAQAEGMFPSASDWMGQGGKTRQIKRQKGLELFDQMEAGTPTLNRLGLKSSTAAPAPMASSIQDGATGTDKRTGRAVIRQNGAWIYR